MKLKPDFTPLIAVSYSLLCLYAFAILALRFAQEMR